MLEAKCRLAIECFAMLSRGDSVVVGLSGGADSCALLHFLCSLREELSLHIQAVHVNHMIRGEEAERDAAFAEAFCKKLDVSFRLCCRDVPAIAAQKGIGLEECGREIRYGIFQEEAEKCGGKIATAHTRSDSVETVLFHIIRGCSVNGLKGIPPVRGNIIRPLICCERSEIEAYCASKGIAYVTDSTNLTTDYARNKIRRQILPLMRELNPSVSEAIGRLTEAARADDAFISDIAAQAADEYLHTGCADRLFAGVPPVMSRALMAICAERLHILPEQKHVYAMMECMARGEGSVNLPGNHIFSVKNKTVFFTNKTSLLPREDSFPHWEVVFSPGEIITPYGQTIKSVIIDKNKYNDLCKNEENDGNVFKNCLDYDKINKAVFRFRREGDKFSQTGRGITKSLKKLYNEQKIPVCLRQRLPLLDAQGVVAWICGIGTAERFKVTHATQRVLYINAEMQDIIYQGGFLDD